ncbi:MAG: PhoPQ-activated pathogenicity-related family protein, partial [Gammaproteobacteria bacterium]|nr:PhoPQ-activated pathogenicity-related family protein [Gammaproteobacteria bacterium]
MKKLCRYAFISLATIQLALFPPFSFAAGSGSATALEEYVYTPDAAYSYTLTDMQEQAGFTLYTLLMDSLQWRSAKEVERRLWTHQVLIVIPKVVTTQTALMLINGGSNPPGAIDPLIVGIGAAIAAGSGSVLASVSQIPNQPLQFPDEGAPISEEALVAYSWDKALATGDGSWAAYMPMTKASVRAMDAVQTFVNEN